MGGTCGDLITAVIDPTNATITGPSMTMGKDRVKLKKPHLFNSIDEKDRYIQSMTAHYRSLPSHDTTYHIDRGHDFISVIVQDMPSAQWATTRFKTLHHPDIWQEMLSITGFKDENSYAECMIHYSELVMKHTDKCIELSSIVNGNMIGLLSKYVSTPLHTNIYSTWLRYQ